MSPLLSVSDTSIVFVDPRRRHLDSLRATSDHTFTDALKLIASAAATAAVSQYFVTDAAIDDLSDWLVQPDGARIHFVGNSGPSWSNSGLAAELKASGRSNLVICGFWLETKVSFLALCALSSGFDVSNVEAGRRAASPTTARS